LRLTLSTKNYPTLTKLAHRIGIRIKDDTDNLTDSTSRTDSGLIKKVT